MNKILTIPSTIFAAIGILFLIIGLLNANVISMAGSETMSTGFLVFASFLLMLRKN